MRKLIWIALFVVACGGPDQPLDPCETNPCLNGGACSALDGNAVCDCSKADNFFGEKCNLRFDPNDFTAHKVFCQSDSGRLEIKGATGSEAYLNGYWVNVPSRAFSQCVTLLLSPARGINLPTPDSDRIVPQAHGLEVLAVVKDEPYKDGKLNSIQPTKELELHFANHRGRVLLLNEVSGKLKTLSASLVKTGTIGLTTHLSPFYLLDGKPTAQATATHIGNGEVILDFTGTKDEGFSEALFLTFSATENGSSMQPTLIPGETHKYKLTLPGGNHTFKAKVLDPYGNEDTKEISLTVDLCSGVSCQSWETCRELDGQCVGNDPCSPSPSGPCKNGGTCNANTGSAVCTCTYPWTGSTCELKDYCVNKVPNCPPNSVCQSADGFCKCNTGYAGTNCGACDTGYAGYPNCIIDPCYNNPLGICSGKGQCNTGATPRICSCNTGFAGATCDQCDTVNGYVGTWPNCTLDKCFQVSCPANSTCQASDGSCSCNAGYTDTDPSTTVKCTLNACVTTGDKECGGNGTCTAGTCVCSGNFDPSTKCTMCKTGFTGATCNACATGYEGYPTCVPDVTPPATPVITTNGGNNMTTFQDNTTVQGTCASDTYTMWVTIDGGTASQLTYTAGSTTWSYNAYNPTVFTDHTYCFYAKDQVGNNSGTDCILVAREP